MNVLLELITVASYVIILLVAIIVTVRLDIVSSLMELVLVSIILYAINMTYNVHQLHV